MYISLLLVFHRTDNAKLASKIIELAALSLKILNKSTYYTVLYITLCSQLYMTMALSTFLLLFGMHGKIYLKT